MKMFEAMIFKSEIRKSCNLDAKMVETSKDGLILTINKRLVDPDSLQVITNLVNQHKLYLLLEFGHYYISEKILAPASAAY